MRRAMREHLRDVVGLVLLVGAALVVLAYILLQQGVRPPWEESPLRIRAQFSTAQAVTPGQGQTVRIAGVRIGDVEDVALQDGRAVLELAIDAEYADVVRRGAGGLLRPRTPLKDMFIELDPGPRDAPALGEGDTIGVSNTLPDVNPDEILGVLDTDTRDYVRLLLQGAAEGLEGRGGDLREVLRRFEPTYRDLARVSSATAQRRRELRRLVTSLAQVSEELGERDDVLAELVDSAARSFGTLADRQTELAGSVRRLPGTLRQASSALAEVEGMARVLRPAARELLVVPPALVEANRALRPFALEAAPLLRDDIRPFVRAARPALAALRPAAARLARAEPGLMRSFRVLTRLVNMLGHNPRGAEGPGVRGRDEGFMFHSAWGAHTLNSTFGWADAHGSGRKAVLGATCADFRGLVAANPLAELGLGLTFILNDPRVCGGQGG